MKLNHFPLNPALEIFQTEFAHNNPRAFMGYLRHEGHVPEHKGDQVAVYHGGPVPEFRGAVAGSSRRLQLEDADYSRGVSALIRQSMVRSGYVLTERGTGALHPLVERQRLQPPLNQPAEIGVYAHLSWQWEIERHSGGMWLVVRPGRKFLSALGWESNSIRIWANRVATRDAELHMLCLNSGKRGRLEFHNDAWASQRNEEGRWHLSFSMAALKDLNLSGDAHMTALPDMNETLRLVRQPGLWEPFVTTLEPFEHPGQIIGGKRLRFGRGLGRDVSDVHKKGILRPPPVPVRLVVVPPQLIDQRAAEQLRRELLAHLLPRDKVLKNAEATRGLRTDLNRKDEDDTLHTLWSAGQFKNSRILKLGLEPFDLVNGLHTFEPDMGTLCRPDALQGAAEQAKREGRQLIGLTVLPDGLTKEARDILFRQLKDLGIHKIQSVSRTMLNRTRPEYMAWVNMAVKLARTAGAVPWDVVDLPGVTENTVFIGVDLGHDHHRRESVPAFSLHDNLGRPVCGIVLPRQAGNERLNLKTLSQGFKKVLRKLRPDQVIVHRDGRFLEGEVDDFLIALNDLGVSNVSLLAVKKSTLSMVTETQDGAVLLLSGQRCLLVPNTQAAVARPTELEMMHSDSLTFEQLTEQVFWLTRVFMNNVQHSSSDPAPIEWANGMARTGRRSMLPGWDRSAGMD